jgi:hypothetical protein
MHHVHVKRKEKQMNRYVMEEFYQDPQLRRRLFSEARRERNRAVRAGLAWLVRHLKPNLHFSAPRWTERLG